MKRLVLLFALFFAISFSATLSAQTTAKSIDGENPSAQQLSLVDASDASWSFYQDEENQTYYIDFESINFNLHNIIVKNQSGEIVVQEDVSKLPVDAIYELDLNPYGKGEYDVELQSFTKKITKKVTIK